MDHGRLSILLRYFNKARVCAAGILPRKRVVRPYRAVLHRRQSDAD